MSPVIRPATRLALLAILTIAAHAGEPAATVTSDTTVVVINGDSPASGEVARAWMRLRGIAEDRAVVLMGIPLQHQVSLAEFHRLVLAPLEVELVRRGRAASTVLVAYGPDFPTAISFDDAGQTMGFRSPGSLTGMTLLAPLHAGGARMFTAPEANPYADRPELPGLRESLRAMADVRMQRADQLLLDKKYTEAEALLRALADHIPAPGVFYNLACAQALGGMPTEALGSLGKAIDAGWFDEQHARKDADLSTLRNELTWPALIARMQAQALRITPGPSVPFSVLPARDGSPPGRLAILLGATSGRGLTIEEIIANLTRSVAADGITPAGTVYFMASKDEARTGPRRWAFTAAAQALHALGVHAEVREGILPPKDAQVIGAVIGIADFAWAANGAIIQPGAWCDHLTSTGGALQKGAGQTPLTAFLRAGAAGAGGTVAEPLNYPFKFPSAFVHLHRARGLSLVEAVHCSLSCPYQYLVVGDPLSRPWPRPVTVAP